METTTKYLDNLTADAQRLAEIQADILADVEAARTTGASWAEIGRALGITKQAAQQKYGSKIQTTPAVRQPETNIWMQADVSAGTTPSMIVAPEPPAAPAADSADLVQRHASEITYKFWSEARAEGHEPAVEWDADKCQLVITVRNISIQRGWVMLSQITTQHATRKSHRHYYLRAYSQTAPGKKISRYDAFRAIESSK